MAIAENGPHSNHRGRLGNTLYYTLNGKNVSRVIGVNTKPPTDAQLKTRMTTKLCSTLLTRLHDFIQLGFKTEATMAMDNAFNQATKYNKPNIIKGDFPNLEIAYDQLLLSKGSLLPAQNWQVTQIAQGLLYTWATDPQMAWPQSTDQVMMLAYFPELEKSVYTLFGNSRLSGSALLEIAEPLKNHYMETYISFIAADRSQVANSIYTGSFNGQEPEMLKLNS